MSNLVNLKREIEECIALDAAARKRPVGRSVAEVVELANQSADFARKLLVVIKCLEDLKHLNNHTIEEEMWRINEAFEEIGREG